MSVTLTPGAPASLTPHEIDARLAFLESEAILDIDLSGLTIGNSADANLLYDRIESRIAATGRSLWFFLINYRGTRIEPGAWVAYTRRGKDLNLTHSMGTVRHDATEATKAQIQRSAGTDNFDPNLFANRKDAIERLRGMPSKRVDPIVHLPSYAPGEFRNRIRFLEDDQIMEVDFSNITFAHSRDVNDCYDEIGALVEATGCKWYFLVNYDKTRIFSEAWIQYAARGKALNEAFSLGSVRYAPDSETETDIRLRAESGGFRPNIRNTRALALERIAELKAEGA